MTNQTKNSTNHERAWRILLLSITIAGTFFFLGAVPLIFGCQGEWSGVLLQTLLTGGMAAITVWLIESAGSKSTPSWWSAGAVHQSATRALKLGALATAIVLIVTLMLPVCTPGAASFNVAITLALSLGAWCALVSYVGFRLRNCLET